MNGLDKFGVVMLKLVNISVGILDIIVHLLQNNVKVASVDRKILLEVLNGLFTGTSEGGRDLMSSVDLLSYRVNHVLADNRSVPKFHHILHGLQIKESLQDLEIA